VSKSAGMSEINPTSAQKSEFANQTGKQNPEELEKKLKAIIQLFVVQKLSDSTNPSSSKLQTIMLRGRDTIQYLTEQLQFNKKQFRCILFHDKKILDQLQNSIVDYGIPPNSTLEMELIPRDDVIPCEHCSESFTPDEFYAHSCFSNPIPTQKSSVPKSVSQPKKPNPSEAMLPCELCGELFPVSLFIEHESQCGK